MKKILSHTLLLFCILSLMPIQALAETEEEAEKRIQAENLKVIQEVQRNNCVSQTEELEELKKRIEEKEKEIEEIKAGMDTSIWGRTAEEIRLHLAEGDLRGLKNDLMNIAFSFDKECADFTDLTAPVNNLTEKYIADTLKKIKDDYATKSLIPIGSDFDEFLKETVKFAESMDTDANLGANRVDDAIENALGKIKNESIRDLALFQQGKAPIFDTIVGAGAEKGISFSFYKALKEPIVKMLPEEFQSQAQELAMKSTDSMAALFTVNPAGKYQNIWARTDVIKDELNFNAFLVNSVQKEQTKQIQLAQQSSSLSVSAVENATSNTSSHPVIIRTAEEIKQLEEKEKKTKQEGLLTETASEDMVNNQTMTPEMEEKVKELVELYYMVLYNSLYKELMGNEVAGTLYSTNMLISNDNPEQPIQKGMSPHFSHKYTIWEGEVEGKTSPHESQKDMKWESENSSEQSENNQ